MIKTFRSNSSITMPTFFAASAGIRQSEKWSMLFGDETFMRWSLSGSAANNNATDCDYGPVAQRKNECYPTAAYQAAAFHLEINSLHQFFVIVACSANFAVNIIACQSRFFETSGSARLQLRQSFIIGPLCNW